MMNDGAQLSTMVQENPPADMPPIADNCLLVVARHSPVIQTASKEHDLSRVLLDTVKKGTYDGKEALFILCQVELASAPLTSFGFDLEFTDRRASARPRSNPLDAPDTNAQQAERARVVGSPRRSYAEPRSFGQRITSTINQTKYANITGHSMIPEASHPRVVAFGPSAVAGPVTDVSREVVGGKNVRAEGGGGGVKLKLFKLFSKTKERHPGTPGPSIKIQRWGWGIRVLVSAAPLLGAGCPKLFKVGVVVQHPASEVRISAAPSLNVFERLRWYVSLVRTPIHNTDHRSPPTCCQSKENGLSSPRPCSGDCAEFNIEHMTPAVWMENLAAQDLSDFVATNMIDGWVKYPKF